MNAEDSLPLANIKIYKLLYKIEIGLREFVVEELSKHYGAKWHKTLPDDVKKKMTEGKECEKKASWVNFIPFHPMYYIDFTDLVKIIEQGDKWRDVFSEHFKRKEIISSTLKELEPIRNKIAHNRKATEGDLAIVESAMCKLNSWMTPEFFNEASKRCTTASSLKDSFINIRSHINVLYSQIIRYEVTEKSEWWRSFCSEWWFDTEYIGITVEPIVHFMSKAVEYANLPRDRGCGHFIEKWVADNNIAEIYRAADNSINQIVEANR